MSDDDPTDDLDDLLSDDLKGPVPPPDPRAKKGAQPLIRSAKQREAAAKAAIVAAEQAETLAAQTKAQAAAQRLAQVVNLHISGFSLAEIGAQIGASAEEVDRMISQDAMRYIRSQPALRTYVRNYISAKYTKLLDSVWDRATDSNDPKQLEYQDRAIKNLERMARLHGAEAPTQSEIKVESAPESVESVVARLAAQQGLGYDVNVFDTVPGSVIHSGPAAADKALEVSGNAVEDDQPDDEPLGDG